MAKTTNSNIRPLFSNVLVKPLEAETTTASGIIITDTAKEQQSTVGYVMAIGEGKILPEGDREAIAVKVGDKVMYKKWVGNEIKVDNAEWTIVDHKDILAIVE